MADSANSTTLFTPDDFILAIIVRAASSYFEESVQSYASSTFGAVPPHCATTLLNSIDVDPVLARTPRRSSGFASADPQSPAHSAFRFDSVFPTSSPTM